MVWLPDLEILFGGCAVRPASEAGMGNTADADLEAWAASIRRVRDRYRPRLVIPSHGQAGTADLLDHTIALAEAAVSGP